MSTFDNNIIEVPQHGFLHIFTGTVVITAACVGSLLAIAWLF